MTIESLEDKNQGVISIYDQLTDCVNCGIVYNFSKFKNCPLCKNYKSKK